MEVSTEFARIPACDFAQAKSTAGIVLPHRISSAPTERRARACLAVTTRSVHVLPECVFWARMWRAELRFGGERFVTRRGCPTRSELLALPGRAEHERLMCSALASH